MSASIDSNFSIECFDTLSSESRRALYQEANETHNVNLVKQLNGLGMKPEAQSIIGPSIISNYMDIATKYDIILGFLKTLRQTYRLFTKDEFQSLFTKKWIKKSQLGRILGCDHLAQKIEQYQLKYIKIPLKIAVLEDVKSLNIQGWECCDFYEFNSDEIKIYAEEITPIKRKLTRDEIDELIQIIALANFSDLNPENILLTEDSIYFIDTEFKSFAKLIAWEKMERFEFLVNEEDLIYFRTKIREKMNEPKAKKEHNEYDSLINTIEMLKEVTPVCTNLLDKLQNKIIRLEYVGLKKFGSNWSQPNHFSFALSDIITE